MFQCVIDYGLFIMMFMNKSPLGCFICLLLSAIMKMNNMVSAKHVSQFLSHGISFFLAQFISYFDGYRTRWDDVVQSINCIAIVNWNFRNWSNFVALAKFKLFIPAT